MGAFDPDKFLAEEKAPTPFDPDAFLAQKEEPATAVKAFDPDAFLASKPEEKKKVAPVAPTEKESFPLLREAADVPLKLGAGLVTGVRLVADAMGADSGVSKSLRGAEDYIAALYSAQSKKDSQEIARIMKDAEDKGLGDQVLAAAKAFSVAPVDLLVNALGTSAPAIAAGVVATLTGAPAAVATAAGLGIGALMGAGTVKGSIYDATKQILSEQTQLKPEEIEARAIKAQEYGGKNLDQIILGAGLGMFGASSGIEPALARQLAKGIATTAAQKEAVKEATRKAVEEAAKRGVVKHGIITGGKEFLGEAAEGGQEQMAQNIAQQREGFNVPTMQGVAGQATLEGLAGLGMGVPGGMREAYKAKRELAQEETAKTGEKFLGQFTTSKEEAQRAGTGFSEDTANLLKSAQDTAGADIVPNVEEPEIAGAAQKAANIKSAEDLLAKVDANEKVTRNDINPIGEALGIKFPAKATNEAKIGLIRAHLQGGANVTGSEQQPAGTSTDLAAQPSTDTTTGGAEAVKSDGVATTNAAAAQPAGGKTAEPATLAFDAKAGLEELNKLDAKLKKAEKQLLRDENLETGNPKIQAAKDNLAKVKAEVEKRKAELYKQFDGWTAAREQTKTVQPTAVATKTAPETVNHLEELSKKVETLANDGKGRKFNGTRSIDKALTRAINEYNEFKEKHGISDEDGLPATYRNTEALALMGKKVYATPRTDEEAVLATEEEEQTNYDKNLKESYEGKESTYDQKNLPEGAQEEYEGTAKEVDAEVEQHNEGRAELVKKQEEAKKQLTEARDALDAYEESQPESADINAADPVVERAEARIAELKQAFDDATDALHNYGGERTQLPVWNNLKVDEKDVYYSHIKNNTIEEHRTAGRALQEYRARKVAEGRVKEKPGKSRVVNGYEESRAFYSKLFGFEFPIWSKLSNAAQNVYLEALTRTDTNATTGKSTVVYINAGIQKPMGFAKVGLQILQEQEIANKEISEREAKTRAELKEEVARLSREKEAYYKYLNEDSNRNKDVPVNTEWLPTNVIQMVMNKDLKGVLNYLRHMPLFKNAGVKTADHMRIMKALAQALHDLNLNTKIEFVESLSNGDLARYDPKIDTILVTPEGLTASTVLHEVTHAGTVRVIHMYTYKDKSGQYPLRKNLTAQQRRGVENLEAIMKETEDYLAINHTDKAYSNLFEFAAYALTDPELVQSLKTFGPTYQLLAKMNETKATVATTPKEKKGAPETMWSAFKKTVAQMLNVSNKPQVKKQAQSPNFLFEVASAIDDILSVPTEPIYLGTKNKPITLAAKKPQLPPLKAAPEMNDTGGLKEDAKNYELSKAESPDSNFVKAWRLVSTREGWRNIVKLVHDKGYHSRSLFLKMDRANLIIRDMSSNFNNWLEQGDLGIGQARQFVTDYLQESYDQLRGLMQDYVKMTGKSMDKILPVFHQIAEARTAGERRHVKWVVSVPLSKTENLKHNGKKISAAQRRIDILGDARTGLAGLVHKVELTRAQQQKLWQELEYLAKNHADPLGDSPRISEKMAKRFAKIDPKTGKSNFKGIDINEQHPIYNGIGITNEEAAKRLADVKAMPAEQQKLIEDIFAVAKTINDRTAELNKIGNYWSFPVSNLVGMYNYQNYMPFKGLTKHTLADDLIEFDSKVNGKELQDVAHAAEGRFTTSDNPFLQMMTEGYKAANRAGRRNYTEAIKNASKQDKKLNPNGTGAIRTAEVVENIPFAERTVANLQKYKGGPYIFHYNKDGSVDIIKIAEPKLLNAIRYTFRDASPMLDMANNVVSFIGRQHTRYNYDFAVKNFVIDLLTNAWNIGMSRQLGPAKSLAYIKNMAVIVARNGLGKAFEVALLHEKGDAASKKILLDAAAKDPYVADMIEMIRVGGKTTYMEGFSLKSNMEQLSKSLGKDGMISSAQDFTKFLDSWNNMFEFSSRTAAYSMYKKEALQRNIDKGMSNVKGPQGQMSPAELAAAVEAAAWTKNLTNFEKSGEKARGLGAAYMFVRPSAASAVRSVEAVMPAFTLEKWEIADLPPEIANDPVAKAAYLENFKKEQNNARIMVSALVGAGVFMYWMASLMAPDDEWKRNAVKSDNMEQWTRVARFHLPDSVSKQLGLGKDVVIQVPFGFGNGTWLSIGAQLAGMSIGQSSVREGLGNIVSSLTDSFLPIPVSKIPPLDSPLNAVKFLVDSIMPSLLRPITEYLMDTNGIGQKINSASTRRLGDAYTGSDRVPEMYKAASDYLSKATNGYIDWSPNTVYFFANSYIDGISRVAQNMYSWNNFAKGEKDFNARTDIPLFGSFFGAKTNVDSREYGRVEEQIKELQKRIKTLEEVHPENLGKFINSNPYAMTIVDVYSENQGELNELRQEANEVRNLQQRGMISPKDRDAILKVIILQENILKHEMVTTFKAYGMKP